MSQRLTLLKKKHQQIVKLNIDAMSSNNSDTMLTETILYEGTTLVAFYDVGIEQKEYKGKKFISCVIQFILNFFYVSYR